jgi:glycosyltransferase involved in cell wall biosynthesis
MRVCHVTPTYFSAESVLGGGERFAEELSRAMSHKAEVKFISFGRRAMRERVSPSFKRVILRSWSPALLAPWSPRLFRELCTADVIHCCQYFVLSTFLATLWGRMIGARVFVSDLGGGGWTPGYHVDQSRWIAAHLPISEYAARFLPGRNQRYQVIYGGADLEKFPMRPRSEHDGSVVFLGRLLPHKGVHVLIEALPAGVQLHVIGTAANADYLARLQRMATGKRVTFHLGLADTEIVGYLQRAMALVHPTPVDADGSAGVSELFCLALAEAMACGCPVIASQAASLPEIVEDGRSGLLVPPADPEAIENAIASFAADARRWAQVSDGARKRVEQHFTWDRVVDRCLAAYERFTAGNLQSPRERATTTAK